MPTQLPAPAQATLADRLRAAGIPHATQLAALSIPALRIRALRTDAGSQPLGASRFGGTPDVPPDFAWPTRNGRPLSFLAQLDLSSFSAPSLPGRGWLLFFYDPEQPWGYDPQHAGGAQVLHVDAAREALVRTWSPAEDTPDFKAFRTCALSFVPAVSLPDPDDSLVEDAGIELGAHASVYHAAARTLSGGDEREPAHLLLGHPQLLQNDMRRECQLAANGISTAGGGPWSFQAERVDALLKDAGEWRMLLQLDTDDGDDGPGWMWGDCGRLYFWIRSTDLQALAFERAWCVLQC